VPDQEIEEREAERMQWQHRVRMAEEAAEAWGSEKRGFEERLRALRVCGLPRDGGICEEQAGRGRRWSE
jgi:hypothetical protein